MRNTRLLAAAAVASALAVPALAEDLTIVYKTTGPAGPGTATSYYTTEKVRMGGADNEMIMDYGAGKFYNVDHKKKEYSEITFEEMQAAVKAATAKMDEMQKSMANMPPAVREKMQSMMGGGAAAVTVTKGATRQVAGYTCQDYTVAAGEAMAMKLCATTALQYPTDYRKYQAVAGPAMAMASNPMFSKIMDEMKKIEGVTISEATAMKMMGRSMDTSREAVEIKKGSIPAATFDVAAIAPGYKKVANPMTKMK